MMSWRFRSSRRCMGFGLSALPSRRDFYTVAKLTRRYCKGNGPAVKSALFGRGRMGIMDQIRGRKMWLAWSLAGAAALGLPGCGKPPPVNVTGQGTAEKVKVTLGASKVEPVQRTVPVVGTLYGDEEATISAKVAGRVA